MYSQLSGIKISTEPEDLICYSFDASGVKVGEYAEPEPFAVLWPKTTEEVIRIMRYAHENNLTIVPRGAGTGMTGGSIPLRGCLVISLERMNSIIDFDKENMTALVEPGIINGRFQKEIEKEGLFYPPDPASMNFCTLGGNVAENAGGPRALKYGVTRDYVMGLEAVLPDGSLINTGVKTHKGVVGYDLTRLLVGSEGTLAVITKIRLRLLPLPEDVITLLALFNDLQLAGRAVSSIISSRIIPRTLEFMDREAIKAAEKFHPLGLPDDTEALLLIEIDGPVSTIRKEAEKVVDLLHKLGSDVKVAEDEDARDKLWEARRSLSPALYHISPHKINQDIVVPRNRIPDMIDGLGKISEKTGLKIVNFGHAGDGNIHVNIMVDKGNEEEYRKGQAALKDIFELTLSLGGTISGEHGIGITKIPYIKMEIKEKELSLMRGIKGVFDPKGILNPGKAII
ncbi:MAG: FAD-binding oxidoreductase [Thermodesulfovibrionales bacterium]